MKNYGLDLARERAEQSPDDWRFGALSQPGLASIPLNLREKYLPQGERQFGREDFMDCASRSPHNQLEAQFTWLYEHNLLSPENRDFLLKRGYVNNTGDIEFSDRFTAVLSNTTREGNSLKAPLESIRKNGLIPKAHLPAASSMTWEQYHDPKAITDEMRDLGREFTHRFTINYEQVYRDHFADCLKDDFIGVAGHGWPLPINGIYPQTDAPLNHAFLLYQPKYHAFDNYEEKPQDFTKQLAPDFTFYEYGYRVFISAEKSYTAQVSLWTKLVALLTQLFIVKQHSMKPNYADQIYHAAYAAIGTDVSPDDLANDRLGCAESLSMLMRRVFPELHFPVKLSTRELFLYLSQSPSFQPIPFPERGCIVLSVTGTGNGKVSNGHVGIMGNSWIMSNHSGTGTWEPSHTVDTWRRFYETKGGMPTHYFRRV